MGLGTSVPDPPIGVPATLQANRHHIRDGFDIVARDFEPDDRAPPSAPITAIVLKANEQSIRVRIPGEDTAITLRSSGYDAMRVAPGQLIDATLNKRWAWRGDAYASGSVERAWTDVQALGLEPLPLRDQGVLDLNELYEPYRRPDPYADMWEFFASVTRRAFAFDDIAWGAGVGVDPADDEACLVANAAEIGEHDPAAARELLREVLLADLR